MEHRYAPLGLPMPQRAEEAIDVMLGARYSMVRYLDFQLIYRLQHRFSEFKMYATSDVSLPYELIDAGGFSRHELIAGVTVHY